MASLQTVGVNAESRHAAERHPEIMTYDLMPARATSAPVRVLGGSPFVGGRTAFSLTPLPILA
jgi:hypothetical protein